MEPIANENCDFNLFDIGIHCATRLRMGGICISLQLKKVFLLPALCNFWRIVHLKLYFTLMMLINLFVHVCMICYAP